MIAKNDISNFIRPADAVGSASASAAAAHLNDRDSVVHDRGVFESLLNNAMTNAQLAFESARGLSILSCTARDIARQRRMNQMVENQIIQIEEMFNVFVACTRTDEINHVPMPPSINRERTLINFDTSLGLSDHQREAVNECKRLAFDAAWDAAKANGDAIRKDKRKGGKRKI